MGFHGLTTSVDSGVEATKTELLFGGDALCVMGLYPSGEGDS